MPVYVSQCGACEKTQDYFSVIEDRDANLPRCCGKTTHRIIVGGFSQPDIQPYKSMVTGEMIGSRSQHRDHLKRHNVYEVGNEVSAHLKAREPKKLDREARRSDIAKVLNGKGF